MKQFNRKKKIKINKETRGEYNFKEIALTKMAKRQLLVTLLSILGVTVISLGSAYAVFTSISKSADYNVIKVGTLNIDFGSDSNNTINLSGQYPMTDEEGLKLTPYVFTVTNTGTLTADYEVFIQDDTDMINQDKCSSNQLNKGYIKYKLDTGSPTVLSTIAGSNYKIATGSLNPGGSVTYTLYVWIKAGVGNDVLNKHYHGKIVVEVSQKEPTAVETLLAKANPEDLDYNSATTAQKKEMWTHTHPETEQTEALTDYRYIGANPNNYVTFNDELWRIIGVFTVDDGTGKKEERLKLIRDESIGDYSWDNKGTSTGAEDDLGKNNWTDARLNYLLNPGHESESVGGSLYWNSGSGTCYSGYVGESNATTSCDFTTTGLKDKAKNMIGDTLWYLGGSSTYKDVTSTMFYERERGTTVYSGRDTSWIGKVGLMYPSDYGYATSGGSTTNRNRNACLNKELYNWSESSYSDCKNNDWLYDSSISQWTIMPDASDSYSVFDVYTSGYLNSIFVSNSDGARPVVHLKSNIKITEGNGSKETPYILAG